MEARPGESCNRAVHDDVLLVVCVEGELGGLMCMGAARALPVTPSVGVRRALIPAGTAAAQSPSRQADPTRAGRSSVEDERAHARRIPRRAAILRRSPPLMLRLYVSVRMP